MVESALPECLTLKSLRPIDCYCHSCSQHLPRVKVTGDSLYPEPADTSLTQTCLEGRGKRWVGCSPGGAVRLEDYAQYFESEEQVNMAASMHLHRCDLSTSTGLANCEPETGEEG